MSAKRFCRNACLFERNKHFEEDKIKHLRDITIINNMTLIKDKLYAKVPDDEIY